MTVQPRSITQMQNYRTAYEVGLYVDGNLYKVLGYTERNTLSTLLKYCSTNGKLISSVLSEDELDMEWKKSKTFGIQFANGRVSVRYTGRTERDVAQEMGKIR